MALTKPAVTELRIESSSFDLWHEWLATYFNGAAHGIGANAPVLFPRAVLRYQQHELPKPLEGLVNEGRSPDGVAISLAWVRPSVIRYYWDTVGGQRQQRAFGRCSWMFWIRAELTDKGQGNAKKRAQDTGDLLFALLQNSATTRDLAAKGIHRLRPETPQLVSAGSGSKPGDPDYAMRLLNCTGSLHYAVRSQV